ncbi:MAG: DUF5677 domain-containing protein [Chloroflexota bacterium]|nr:DUF5677 domain-containing protein [Chloroflexota bacterium]
MGRSRQAIESPDNPSTEEIERIVEQLLDEGEATNYQTLKRIARRLRRQDRRTRSRFEKRLMRRWGQAIDLYDLLMIAAQQMGEDVNRENRPQAAKDQDYVFEALTKIHARACLIASEIRALMVFGHASGANARWRSLHELAVVAFFVKQHGNDVAERYILHATIRSAKESDKYEQHYQALGYMPPDPVERRQVLEAREKLVDCYGSDYGSDYGWAAGILSGKPTFAQIEAAVGLAHMRPHFGMASHSVHAGFKGMAFDIGNMGSANYPEVMLAGPSDAGLADPGHGAAISLMQCTVALLNHIPTQETVVGMRMLLRLVDEVGEAFIEAHRKLE